MVLLHKIHKRFSSNGITALDGADFELREGEIHALAGENGAGKSTLMHIMAGFLKPDEGVIIADGNEKVFPSPAKALAEGIGMVRQHPRLVPEFTVWENCVLGSEGFPLSAKRRLRSEIAALDERWSFGLPLDSPASGLTVSQGQKAAILALLRRSARYLVFDEPTAVLSPRETEGLFELFRKLRNEGKGIVLISHKLNEIVRLSDRITVLGRGKTSAVLSTAELEEGRLSELIFGALPAGSGSKSRGSESGGNSRNGGLKQIHSKAVDGDLKWTYTKADAKIPPALELRNFTVNVPGRPLIRGINLCLRRGGITGITGVRDSGLETLELAAAGYLPSSGTIRVNGTETGGDFEGYGGGIRAFRNAGGAYLGTRETGAAEEYLPLRDILVIHAHRRFEKSGFLDKKKLAGWSRRIIKGAGLVDSGPAGEVRSDMVFASTFSGGQFQRIMFIREIAEKSPLLVLAEPGRGLDRRSRDRLSGIIREQAAAGAGALIFSTDSEELLSVCDTVMVLRNGFFADAVVVRDEKTGEEADADVLLERIRKAMVGEA